MSKLRRASLVIFSILFWLFFIVSCIIMFLIAFIIWLVTLPFDKRLFILHQFSSFWGSIYIWLNPLWKVRIEGRKKIDPKKVYVIASNHQSMIDILILYGLFAHYKWLSKVENFKIPIIGWLMRLNKYPEIDRESKKSYKQLMEKVRKIILRGSSIMIFPEGTRYPGGFLGPFREGAFHMALENKVGILPVLLEGTAKTIPKNGIILTGKQMIKVKILDEIPYESFGHLEIKELTEKVRNLMVKEYEKMKMN